MGFEKLIKKNDHEFYSLRYNYEGATKMPNFMLELYDESLKLKKKTFLDFGDKKPIRSRAARKIKDVFMFNNELVVLTIRYSSKDKSKFICVNTIDQETLKVNNDEKILATLDLRKVNKAIEFWPQAIPSKTGSHLILLHNSPPGYFNKPAMLNISAFDKDFALQWTKDYNANKGTFDKSQLKALIDDDGNGYVLFKANHVTDDRFSQTDKRFKYVLLSIPKDGSAMNETVIDPVDKGVFTAGMFLDDNDILTLSGIYHFHADQRSGGIFICKPDIKAKSITSFESADFEDVIGNYEGSNPGEILLDGKYLNNLKFTDIFRASKDEVFVIAEYRNVPIGGQSVSYDNIYSFHFNNNGELEMIIQVEKNQHTSLNFVAFSYYYFATDKSEFFIYNDHLKNLEEFQGKMFNSETEGRGGVIMVEVTREGEQKRSLVMKTSKSKAEFIVHEGIELSEDSHIFFGADGFFRERLMRVNIPSN